MTEDTTATALARRPYSPRQPRGVRREQILDATFTLVVEHGWTAMTMERVAAEAGIAKSVAYAIFGSQAGLQRAVMRRGQERAFARAGRALQSARESADIATAIKRGLTAFLDGVVGDPQLSRLVLLMADGTPDSVRDTIREGRAVVRAGLVGVVQERLATAELSHLDADLIAHLLRDSAESLARLALEHPQNYSPERLAASIAQIAETIASR